MTVVRVMRTMWASTVKRSTATGSTSIRATAATSRPGRRLAMAGSQPRCTANTVTSRVATRKSGTEISVSETLDMTRSHHVRWASTRQTSPSPTARGTASAAVTPASSAVFVIRSPIMSAMSALLARDVPKSPARRFANQA